MLRELSQLLDELHDGLVAIDARDGMRLSQVEMTLPIDVQPVFRDGGCVLLAELRLNALMTDQGEAVLRLAAHNDAGAGATLTRLALPYALEDAAA